MGIKLNGLQVPETFANARFQAFPVLGEVPCNIFATSCLLKGFCNRWNGIEWLTGAETNIGFLTDGII